MLLSRSLPRLFLLLPLGHLRDSFILRCDLEFLPQLLLRFTLKCLLRSPPRTSLKPLLMTSRFLCDSFTGILLPQASSSRLSLIFLQHYPFKNPSLKLANPSDRFAAERASWQAETRALIRVREAEAAAGDRPKRVLDLDVGYHQELEAANKRLEMDNRLMAPRVSSSPLRQQLVLTYSSSIPRSKSSRSSTSSASSAPTSFSTLQSSKSSPRAS